MDRAELHALLERNEEEGPMFPVVLERYMERAGIEDLEELYGRFVQTDHAHIPVRGLHLGKPVSFEEFKRHATAERTTLYGEFMSGVAEALGVDLQSKDGGILVLAYMFGRKPLRLRA